MPTLFIRVAEVLVYNFTGKKRTKKSRHYCFLIAKSFPESFLYLERSVHFRFILKGENQKFANE